MGRGRAALGRALCNLAVVIAAVACVPSTGSVDSPDTCGGLMDAWEKEVSGISHCEQSADCILVGEGDSCIDDAVISRSGGRAVNADAYGKMNAERFEAEYHERGCRRSLSPERGTSHGAVCRSGQCEIESIAVCDFFPPRTCRPTTQQGCAAGEKCATKIESDLPFLSRTTCVPDGIVPPGQACTRSEPGTDSLDGIDDCQAGSDAGFECVDGVCRAVCTIAPNSCADALCVSEPDLFEDVEGAGIRRVRCDLVAQDCWAPEDGCYLNIEAGGGYCAEVAATVAERTQDQPCLGRGGLPCFEDGCAKGHGPLLPEDPASIYLTGCAKVCTPSPTDVDRVDNPAGIENESLGQRSCASPSTAPVPGPDPTENETYQCRFLNSFFPENDHLPDTIGICVDENIWGDCLLQETAACLADPNPPSPLPVDHPCATIKRGCVPAVEISQ